MNECFQDLMYSLVSLLSSVKSLLILSPASPSGTLTSSFMVPSSDIRERKPSSEMSSYELLSASSSEFCCAYMLAYKLVLATRDVRNVHVVGGRAKILQLLAGEDVDSDQMHLGVTVLAGLGRRHLNDLAWAVLDHHETVLPQGRTLHWEGGGRAGIGGLEGVLMLYNNPLVDAGGVVTLVTRRKIWRLGRVAVEGS